MQRFTLLVFLLVFSVVAYGQVYKWTDPDGNVQYTDQPPPAGAAMDERKLNIKSPPPSSVDSKSSAPKNIDDEMQAFKERRTSKQEAEAKKQTEALASNQQCISAQGKLKIYRDTPRLRVPDGEGGLVYADDDMREKNIREAQSDIAAYCK